MASVFPVTAKKVALDGLLVSGHTIKVALFDSTYDTGTTTYSTTDEVTGTGWSAGGVALSGLSTATSGTTAYGDFADVSEDDVTVSGVRYLVVYDTDATNAIVAILDLGADKAVTAGTLAITWPTADASNAVIRIG